jgi:glycosyltransferase involved in cell wall biosynthesis
VIGGDGPERASLEAAAAGLPVTFLGPVPWSERPAFFAGIRLYAQPSLSEGLGLAVLEAAAAGRAAVVTDRGGLPGTVVSGETGFVVPAEPGALAQALAEGLARADELGAAARARALKDGDGAALVAVAEAYRRVACPCQ